MIIKSKKKPKLVIKSADSISSVKNKVVKALKSHGQYDRLDFFYSLYSSAVDEGTEVGKLQIRDLARKFVDF